MEEDAYLKELKDIIKSLNVSREQSIDKYKRRMQVFIKYIPEEVLKNIELETEIERIAVYPIVLGVLFRKNNHKEIIDIVDKNLIQLFVGEVRSYDYFISLIIRLYYLSRKSEKLDNSMLFGLLVSNKELGNEDSVSVITNCILDMLISNKIYQRIENNISSSVEQSRYNYYNGIISMVEGNYEEALELFHTSSILATSRSFALMVQKCIIVCMLLVSDYNIPYEYDTRLKPYFDLISAVKQADMIKFKNILEENREEFMEQNLYFVAKRLLRNVVQEGMRKISLVYSRIPCKDIAKQLNMTEEETIFLVQKTINQGYIKGKVENNVFLSLKDVKTGGDIGLSTRDCIQLTKNIQEYMKYPDIERLCYEKILKSNNENK